MKTEVLTLCDSAQEYLGKSVIVGTFNEIKAEAYPTAIQNVCMAIRIAFNPDEKVESTLTIRAYDVENPDALLMKFETPFNNNPSGNNQRSFTNALLKLDGFMIPKKGTYRFEISIGDWSDNIEVYAKQI